MTPRDSPQESCPAELDSATTADPVWRLPAYRYAVLALQEGWPDVGALARRPTTVAIAGQLYRALGSVAANLAEGYSRSSGADRARLYEYALGSARECVVWYRAAMPVLGDQTTTKRVQHLQQIIRLLLAVIPRERERRITKAP
jgi:four helix bundle protein